MAIQFSIPVRNARLDALTTVIGASANLIIYSGTQPADCSEAPTGTVLATLELPSSWMVAAASGSKEKTGTWSDISADNTGEAGYFRIYDSLMSTCGMQGSVSESGDGGDMIIDNISIVQGQTVSVSSFTLTEGNA